MICFLSVLISVLLTPFLAFFCNMASSIGAISIYPHFSKLTMKLPLRFPDVQIFSNPPTAIHLYSQGIWACHCVFCFWVSRDYHSWCLIWVFSPLYVWVTEHQQPGEFHILLGVLCPQWTFTLIRTKMNSISPLNSK